MIHTEPLDKISNCEITTAFDKVNLNNLDMTSFSILQCLYKLNLCAYMLYRLAYLLLFSDSMILWIPNPDPGSGSRGKKMKKNIHYFL
jgi:hypothetical protein